MFYTLRVVVISSFFFISCLVHATPPEYGNNSTAGHTLNVGDTHIYYETYGKGKPLVLLHGGLFGSIGEFANYIPTLSQSFKVIAIATRGHGKSGIGTESFSYELLAHDAAKILTHETNEAAVVLGFSDGAITGHLLAAHYPAQVSRLVLIGGGLSPLDYLPEGLDWVNKFDGAKLSASFIAQRKALMPEPERWLEFTSELKKMWLASTFVNEDLVKSINVPTLIVGGDKDDFMRTESFVKQKRLIHNAQLLILPNTGHVDSLQNQSTFNQFILPFLIASN